MLRPGGHLLIAGPDGKREHDTFTCGHCQRVVIVRHRAAAADCGGMCKRCMKLTCPRCTAAGACTPFEKKLERAEARARLLKAITG
jgi:hypothetical protein